MSTLILVFIFGISIMTGIWFAIWYFVFSVFPNMIKKHKQNKYNQFWVEYDPNINRVAHPDKNTGDCAIRAVSKLFNLSWNDAFDNLSGYAKKNYCVTTTGWMLYNYFQDRGYSYYDVNNHWYKPDITIGEFAKNHPKGKYAIFSECHVVALIDGKLYDSFNSSHHKVEAYLKEEDQHKKWKITKYREINN